MTEELSVPDAFATQAKAHKAVDRTVDVLVVGAGPSGLSVAAELARLRVGRVEVVDREQQAGGIPRHSQHTGYGLRDLHRVLTGPAYARHYIDLASSAGAVVRTGVSVTGWAGQRTVDATSPDGLERIHARAMVLATGARERPRPARLIPGSRPSGVYTTGELQQAIYQYKQNIGRRAVVVGAEHVSYSAVATLNHAGVQVVAMVTDQPRQQSYAAFRLGAQLRFRFPLATENSVTRIIGRHTVEGVELRDAAGHRTIIECDTVVFTGDWVPDNELARRGGLAMDTASRGPAVDTDLATSAPGVFAAGNLTHPVETADVVALEGRFAAMSIVRFLGGNQVSERSDTVAIIATAPLRWVAPHRVGPGSVEPPRGHFIAWSSEFVRHPRWRVRQGQRTLWSRTSRRHLIPNRPYYLNADWIAAVTPEGGSVVVEVSSA